MKLEQYSNSFAKKIIRENINNFIELNNKYKSSGFEFYLKDNLIEIIYNNNNYTLLAIKEKSNTYWKINYSNKIKYKVKIDNCTDSIEEIIDFISKQRRL